MKNMNINELIDYIKSKDPEEGPFTFSERDWEKFLWNGCNNWMELVEDPNNWPLIEKVKSRDNYEGLCMVFVKTAGAKLALRWFYSEEEAQRKASRKWLQELLYNGFTPQIWNALSDDAKEYIIHYAFERYPGEPFETYKELTHAILHFYFDRDHRFSYIPQLLVTLPPISYIPSHKILQLRSVIRNAGDNRFLKVVEKMINERRKEFEKSLSLTQNLMLPYTPTSDERELIARVMDKFRANGYMLSPLPKIYLSLETPPLFVAYPELEEERIEAYPDFDENGDEREPKKGKPRIPRNRERKRSEYINIEEVLGCYVPNPKIILYQRGLKWVAKKYNLDEELLREVVLIHEIGHWVTHLLPKFESPFWPTELYKLTSTEVHEGWAQLITWWIVNEIGGEMKNVFENLNKLQSQPYHVYEKLTSYSINSVVKSLVMLRQLRWPAGMDDWRRFIK